MGSKPRFAVPLDFRPDGAVMLRPVSVGKRRKPGIFKIKGVGSSSNPQDALGYVKLGHKLHLHRELVFPESEHALTYASFLRFLALRGYFHPNTRFAVYGRPDGSASILTVMPKLSRIPAKTDLKSVAPIKVLRDLFARHPRLIRDVSGYYHNLWDIYLKTDEGRLVSISYSPSNLGCADGKVYARDIGLWFKIPPASVLREVLEKEGYYRDPRVKGFHELPRP